MVDTTYAGGGTLRPGTTTWTPVHGDVVWCADGTGVQYVRVCLADGTESLHTVSVVCPQGRP